MVLNTRMVKEPEKGLIPCFYQTGLGPSSQLNHPVWFKPLSNFLPKSPPKPCISMEDNSEHHPNKNQDWFFLTCNPTQ